MKPKVALVKDGFLPPGSENVRGRLSGKAIERCEALAAQGWDIDGYQVSKTSNSTAPVVLKVKTDSNTIADVPEPTRFESDWTAWVGKQPIGMRTVCNNCRCSLTYCPCESPRVWLDHETQGVVYFKPLKG